MVDTVVGQIVNFLPFPVGNFSPNFEGFHCFIKEEGVCCCGCVQAKCLQKRSVYFSADQTVALSTKGVDGRDAYVNITNSEFHKFQALIRKIAATNEVFMLAIFT